jgi:hypothetical protein
LQEWVSLSTTKLFRAGAPYINSDGNLELDLLHTFAMNSTIRPEPVNLPIQRVLFPSMANPYKTVSDLAFGHIYEEIAELPNSALFTSWSVNSRSAGGRREFPFGGIPNDPSAHLVNWKPEKTYVSLRDRFSAWWHNLVTRLNI